MCNGQTLTLALCPALFLLVVADKASFEVIEAGLELATFLPP